MKLSKALLLLSVFALVACGSQKSSSVSESKENTSSVETSAVISSEETSYVTSSIGSTTSEVATSSTTSTSTQPIITDKILTINLYNPSCGSLSKEVISEKLATYINSVAATTFVTGITSNDCQVTNNIPTDGVKVLQLGAAEKSGTMEFTFANTIKAATITAQTYHKPWVDTWSGDEPITYNNTDPNSVLGIATVGSAPTMKVDLKPDEDEKPVEKEFNIEINANKLSLTSSNADHGRVFIKAITFIY